jgi:2-polyprenyl-6-hydroxyphenyl methylase/3-demethylubiquinone-9 3-methyltransferase
LFSFVKRKILRSQRDRWNYQYERGQWEGLKGPDERERFEAIVAMIRRYAPGGNLLEMGCGEAVLEGYLRDEDFKSLVGVDIADVAIERARQVAGPKSTYFAADMNDFVPTGPFDAIVFTESINYLHNREQLLRKYIQYLVPGGKFIISVFEFKQSPQIWREIETPLRVVDEVRTTNQRGTWVCKVLEAKK